MNPIFIIGQNTIKALIRKKDFYVFLMLLVVLMFFLHLQNFYDIENISRFIKEAGFSAVWLFSFILACVFTAKQVPDEIQTKMIYPLLSKPVTRLHFILGRYVGSLLAVSIAFSAFYFLFVLTSSLQGEGIGLTLIIQGYILGILFLSLVCAVALFFSLVTTYAAAVTLCFILFFCVTILADPLRALMLNAHGLPRALLHLSYYLLPHYEFYNISVRMVHGWPALPLGILFAITIYTLAYVSVVLYFCHRWISQRIF